MKRIFYILSLFAIFLSSCKENEEANEYDNWKARSQHYVDSIAALANEGTDGWTKILAYSLVSTEENPDQDVNHYVYVKKMETGTGTEQPEFNDSVRLHYLGRLIPSASYEQGYIFGKSYSTYTLNEPTDVPALLSVSENVVGVATALMHMKVGDRWKLVLPYYLGYGTESNSTGTIPAYSTLIFDVKLARIYKYKIDTDTTWH